MKVAEEVLVGLNWEEVGECFDCSTHFPGKIMASPPL